jgi:hypothetical protein
VRARYAADWAFTVFVTKFPSYHFAYYFPGRNYVVMDADWSHWGYLGGLRNFQRVFAHEVAHVFGAADEYSGHAGPCPSDYGRYGVANGNCADRVSHPERCLMLGNARSVCDHTRGQLGWNHSRVRHGTATLDHGHALDLRSGAAGPTLSRDVAWRHTPMGAELAPQGAAAVYPISISDFNVVSHHRLRRLKYGLKPVENPGPGMVIGVRTSNGEFAKVLVEAIDPPPTRALRLAWVTYG